MARRTGSFTVTASNRDFGKTYSYEEMPAELVEEWSLRALQCLARAGVDIPPDILQQGAMAVATIGVGACLSGLAKTPWNELKPLLDQLMSCVKSFQAAPNLPPIWILSQIMEQTEEVSTLLRLREEILSLHVGFSIRERLQAYRDMLLAAAQSETMPNTETSPELSASQSLPN